MCFATKAATALEDKLLRYRVCVVCSVVCMVSRSASCLGSASGKHLVVVAHVTTHDDNCCSGETSHVFAISGNGDM